jgi:hypothetical protein
MPAADIGPRTPRASGRAGRITLRQASVQPRDVSIRSARGRGDRPGRADVARARGSGRETGQLALVDRWSAAHHDYFHSAPSLTASDGRARNQIYQRVIEDERSG